jgi:hypothetical protein
MTRRNLMTSIAKALDRPRSARRRKQPRFAEHSLVKLVSRFDLDDGRTLPAGAVGAVVGTWAGGAAYEVEFSEPFHVIAMVSGAHLTEAQKASS